jgi:hypothetical protein
MLADGYPAEAARAYQEMLAGSGRRVAAHYGDPGPFTSAPPPARKAS